MITTGALAKTRLAGWLWLLEAYPALAGLAADALSYWPGYADDKSFCANDVWYEHLKPRLLIVIEQMTRDGIEVYKRRADLGDKPYDFCYATIYHLLPNCRPDCRGLCL